MVPNFSYVRPDSLQNAVKQLGTPGAFVHAGGTDLMGTLREHITKAEKIVSISKLKQLHGIEKKSNGDLRIGALTTITEVAESPVIGEMFACLAQAASEVASPQLRNQGTIGGNLCQKPRCWYYRGNFDCLRKGGPKCFAFEGENQYHCIFASDRVCAIVHPSDTAPALMSLGASVHVVGSNGNRTIALRDFFVLPKTDVTKETVLKSDEIVTEILIPAQPKSFRSRYRKIRARRSWDFALSGGAFSIVFDGDTVKNATVVFSGAAPIPWRSEPLEKAITGKKLDEKTIAAAADAAMADAEPLSKNGYKIPLFKAMIKEELAVIAKK